MGLRRLSSSKAETQTYFSDTDPLLDDSKKVTKGDQWVNEDYKNEEVKIFNGNKWITIKEGTNTPPKQNITSESESRTFHIPNVESIETFTLISGSGQKPSIDSHYKQSASFSDSTSGYNTTNNGKGRKITAKIDLAQVSELNLQYNMGQTAPEETVIVPGMYGTKEDPTAKFDITARGGDGVRITDGSTNVLLSVGGGGSGAAAYVYRHQFSVNAWWTQSYNGGYGNGGGNLDYDGGTRTWRNERDGKDGHLSYNEGIVSIQFDTITDIEPTNAKLKAFI